MCSGVRDEFGPEWWKGFVRKRIVGLFSVLYISWVKASSYQSPDLSTALIAGTGAPRGQGCQGLACRPTG